MVYNLFAPRVGLEPTTNWLTANCSTIELPRISSVFFNDRLLGSYDINYTNLYSNFKPPPLFYFCSMFVV